MTDETRREPVAPQDLSHNYARALLALLAAGAVPVGAEPHCVTIAHDDWCAMLMGAGPCTCDPEVTIERISAPEESRDESVA